MSDGVEEQPEVIEKLRDVSVAARTIQRDQVPEDVVGAAVFLAGPGLGLRHRADDRHRRRPVLPLVQAIALRRARRRPDGRREPGRLRLARNEAHFGAAAVEGPGLCFELEEEPGAGALLSAEVELEPGERWLMRCDRVDFPPGGIAYLHTHPGPGVRCLLFGAIRIESGGEAHDYGPREPWFESGPGAGPSRRRPRPRRRPSSA